MNAVKTSRALYTADVKWQTSSFDNARAKTEPCAGRALPDDEDGDVAFTDAINADVVKAVGEYFDECLKAESAGVFRRVMPIGVLHGDAEEVFNGRNFGGRRVGVRGEGAEVRG